MPHLLHFAAFVVIFLLSIIVYFPARQAGVKIPYSWLGYYTLSRHAFIGAGLFDLFFRRLHTFCTKPAF